MNNLSEDIEELLQTIDETTDLFYQQKNREGYLKLDSTLAQLMNVIETITHQSNGCNVDMNQINQMLSAAMNALEERDTVLFSDIMQYEFKDLLTKIMKKTA